MSNWYTASDVTVANGDKKVYVNSNDPIDAIREHESFEIEGFNGRDIERAYVEDVTGHKIILLVEPWPHATQTNVAAQVEPTSNYHAESVAALNSINEKLIQNWTPLLAFGNQASGTVTFKAADSQGQDVTIKCLAQWNADLLALSQSASNSVAQLNSVDATLNTPETGLVAITATLQSDLAGLESVIVAHKNEASTLADNAENSAVVAASAASSASNDASSASSSASSANSSAGQSSTSASAAESHKNLAQRWASEAEDVVVLNGKFSAFHYATRAEYFAGQAASIAGGTAPDANKLGGIEAANYYHTGNKPNKSDVGLDNVNNTADIDKPVSTAQQNALDGKASSSHSHTKSAVGLSEVDNTADLDKPISTATQSALDDIEALALASL